MRTKIKYYKTNLGVLFSGVRFGLRFNDHKEPEDTFHSSWKLLRDEESIEQVLQQMPSKQVNPRWVLKEPSLASEAIPDGFTCEEVGEYYDDEDYEWCWANHQNLRSLYERKTDTVEGEWESVEFEVEALSEVVIEHPEDPIKMEYKLQRGSSYDNSVELPKEINGYWGVKTSDISKALVPDLFWHYQPCYLDKNDTFALVRAYIRDHLDGRYARITSDYDFCFTVKKRIPIKPYIHKMELKKLNGRSYARPRFKETTITHKEVEVFNMAPKAYQSYDVIKGFKGENLADLKENIDLYLKELIDRINAPIIECDCCKGLGTVLEKIDLNGDRN